MRYGDWDVLLFPADSRVPIKEFQVRCILVHDEGKSCVYQLLLGSPLKREIN